MATIVAAGALSHSPIINAEIEPTAEETRQIENFRNGARELGRRIVKAEPQAIVIFGPDHFRAFFYDVMPQFCVGTGRVRGWGDWATTNENLPTAPEFARHILRELLDADFDTACSYDLRIDHGMTQAVPLLEQPALVQIPVVPIFINCAAPPLPKFSRCFELGRAVFKAVNSWKAFERVAVIGSGGLSHTVPAVSVESSDAAHLEKVEKMIHGRPFVEVDAKMRESGLMQTIPQFSKGINPIWDHTILDFLQNGETQKLISFLSDRERADEGGNGGQEARNWLATAGTVENSEFEVLSYEPIPVLITGMSVVSAKI